jgi:phosphoribosylanthranilate isomerase
MQIKVCGIAQPGQANSLQLLGVDYVGFIFYSKSPRCVSGTFQHNVKNAVGVFVNPTMEEIYKAQENVGALQYIQLHGSEAPSFCKTLKSEFKIIKAFGVHTGDNIDALVAGYEEAADLFLFDTKSVQHGGTGKKFDWSILHTYTGNIPFLLSGGIAPNDAALVQQVQHHMLLGVDINSAFETAPGIKDLSNIKNFIHKVKQKQ